MSRRAVSAICLLTAAVFSLVASADAVVTFPDPGLDAETRAAIGKPTGDILESDLVGLTALDASERAISDLTGIEHCVDLQYLWLWGNQISDLAPLAALTALKELYIWGNQISGLSPLAGLTQLTSLNLGGNQISELAPLAGLTALARLELWSNQISDLSSLAGLSGLAILYLWTNQIRDLSPLAGLTALTDLDLDQNQISDLSPLAGMTALTYLSLWTNQIRDLSPLAGLTALRLLYLHNNQISDIGPLVLNGGISSGDVVYVQWNYLCLDCASGRDWADINLLRARGVSLECHEQTGCWRDSAAVFGVDPCGNITSDRSFYGSTFNLGAADIAEWVPISESMEPGDVVELDTSYPGSYRPSHAPCSALIAGVVSSEPGVTLGGTEPVEGKALLALSGIVPVKVTNEGGPIQPGDLLVSSSTPGYAMRWAGTEPCPCALVGKALEPMAGELGMISVLLTAH
jgi:hypothetical protein